jgi:hypothetical protein
MASFKMDLDLPGWRKIIGTPAHGITKQSSQLLAYVLVRVLERYYRSLATQDALGFVGPSGDTTATRHTRHKPADAHGTSDGHGK